MHLIDSIETNAHGMTKDLIWTKEKIKRINIIKQYKKELLWWCCKRKSDIDKIYLYAKDPYETKYKILVNKRKSTSLKDFNDFKAFIQHSNVIDNIYKNIEDYNLNKKRKILIVFEDMIADVLSTKKLNSIVTELVIRGRKLNSSLLFITQYYFAVPKDMRLNCMHYFLMKVPNIEEL